MARAEERWGGFEHPATIAVASGVALAGSALVASRRPVLDWELRFTERINDVPDVVASTLYPLMQLGTLAGPLIVAAGIVAFRRNRLLGATTMGAGLVAWFGAKGVKRIVERDRPRTYLPEILIREGDGSGLGFVSGHSAVAATAALIAMTALPSRWRWVPPVLAGVVGMARIVHGVHLPADVIGGWSFGVLLGLGALGIADVARTRAPTAIDVADVRGR